jgi:membrane protein implicated in regulation of membrane protease activity
MILSASLIWFLVGVAFLVAELAVPGFILIFFTAGCWIAAMVTWLFNIELTSQIIIFIVSSLTLLFTLRKYSLKIFKGKTRASINEAEGQAKEIEVVAHATAEGIKKIAESLSLTGGETAANLRVAEKYIAEFGKLAKENNTMIIPANMGDISAMVATLMSVLGHAKQGSETKGA